MNNQGFWASYTSHICDAYCEGGKSIMLRFVCMISEFLCNFLLIAFTKIEFDIFFFFNKTVFLYVLIRNEKEELIKFILKVNSINLKD